jgi:hypothetical protein
VAEIRVHQARGAGVTGEWTLRPDRDVSFYAAAARVVGREAHPLEEPLDTFANRANSSVDQLLTATPEQARLSTIAWVSGGLPNQRARGSRRAS